MSRGTVFNRGTKDRPNYTVIIERGRDPVTGQRRREWYPGFKSKKEAEQARTRLLNDLDNGRYVEPTKLTLKELLDEWLEVTSTAVRASTHQSYEANVRLHIVPAIGGMRVQDLTPTHLNSLYKRLLVHGRADGKGGLRPKTVRNIHICLHRALTYAVRTNLVVRNVASNASPPRQPGFTGKEMRTWSAEQLREFLMSVSQHRYFAAYLLAATTGMRRGEVLGLTWDDVDLDARTVSVRQTLLSINYKVQLSEPKTQRSKRCIALDAYTVAVLKEHRARQEKEHSPGAGQHQGNGFVFTTEEGLPVQPDNFSKLFDTAVKKSGLPRIRFHDLRHTAATLALREGIHPKVVSERLGHSTVSLTLDLYSHAIPALQQEAADRLAALVFSDGWLQNGCNDSPEGSSEPS
ncbi:MAG: site-specific integrase [Actinomycetia bacterium]|nr:site-specific integrase [Actinomycetes bacterium]